MIDDKKIRCNSTDNEMRLFSDFNILVFLDYIVFSKIFARASAKLPKQFNEKINQFQNLFFKSKINSPESGTDNKKVRVRRPRLQPGDLVQVKSLDEIMATLDKNRKYRGLYFMGEMRDFCGKKFRVYKNVDRILLECTGEIRKIKTRTVFLENVICDGSKHGGCDRSCFLYWREKWLKKVDV
jgi:hypothetical protein